MPLIDTVLYVGILQSACAAAAIHCKEKGKNISKLALQFALDNQDISTTLVGMNSVEQVRNKHYFLSLCFVLGISFKFCIGKRV